MSQDLPEGLLQVVPVRETRLRVPLDDYPGFKDWMLTQYALGTTTRRIKERLFEMRSAQAEQGVAQWPEWSKGVIDSYRSAWESEWLPVQHRISQQIETQGVLAKNKRLLALLRMAEELEEKMWDERNSKSGQLYLIRDYRETLKQIAEEKGELGEGEASTDPVLARIALNLSEALKIQGSGIQDNTIDGEFDYFAEDEEDGEFEETTV